MNNKFISGEDIYLAPSETELKTNAVTEHEAEPACDNGAECPESCFAAIRYYCHVCGSLISSESVGIGSAVMIAQPPLREGYEFSHWEDNYGETTFLVLQNCRIM